MKPTLNYFSTFILCLMLSIQCVYAQSGTYHTIQDFESWSSINLKYKPTKKIKLNVSQQLRLKDNSSNLDAYFTQVGIDYKLNKQFSIGLATRYITENDDQGKITGNEYHLRWQGDLEYKNKINRASIEGRIRYQSKDELRITTDNLKKVIRFKLGLGYNIPNWKLDPTFSSEIFNNLTTEDGLYRIRYTLQTSYDLAKQSKLGIFIRTEKGLVGEHPKRTNILGLKYNFIIKK